MTDNIDDKTDDKKVLLDEFDFSSDPLSLLKVLVQDVRVLAVSRGVLSPKHFKKTTHRWLYTNIDKYYKKYKTVPSLRYLKRQLDIEVNRGNVKTEFYEGYLKDIKRLSLPVKGSLQAVKDELNIFIQRSVCLKLADTITNSVLHGKPDEEEITKLSAALDDARRKMGSDSASSAVDVVGDFDTYVNAIKDGEYTIHCTTVGTGVPGIDRHLADGGIAPGEVGVVMGTYGSGKSMFLGDVAANALRAGLNVFYASLEVGKLEIMKRIVGNLAGMKTELIASTSSKSIFDQLNQRFRKRIVGSSGDIRIKEYPSGLTKVEDISADIALTLDIDKFKPDVLIIDYVDILAKPSSNMSTYDAQGENSVRLRGLASEHELSCWTATQVNRGGMSKRVIKGDNVADSLVKMMTADVVISINEEGEEALQHQKRLYVDKNRKGKSGMEVAIRTGFEWGRFYMGMVDIDPDTEIDYMERVRPASTSDAGVRYPVVWLPDQDLNLKGAGDG
jgi:replicative DNA helicase